MVSPAALDDPGIDLETQAVGAGPYEVVSFERDQRLVLQRKEDYWDVDNWPLKTIEFRNVMDGAPRVTALSAGDIQFTLSADPTLIDALANNPAIEVLTAPSPNLFFVNFCKSRPPFDDPDVRRAFTMALDRSGLVDAMTAGHGEAAFQVWPKDSPNFNPDAVTPYDVEQARELLGGREVSANMAYLTFLPGYDRLFAIMQAQLAEVGIHLEARPLGNPADLLDLSNDSTALQSTNDGVRRISEKLHPAATYNLCKYSDPKLTALFDKTKSLTPGSDEAAEAWHEIAEMVDDEALIVPLFFQANATAFRVSDIGAIPFTTPYVDYRYVYAK
jgi:peptide/nickel transport system substrate-binding protein